MEECVGIVRELYNGEDADGRIKCLLECGIDEETFIESVKVRVFTEGYRYERDTRSDIPELMKNLTLFAWDLGECIGAMTHGRLNLHKPNASGGVVLKIGEYDKQGVSASKKYFKNKLRDADIYSLFYYSEAPEKERFLCVFREVLRKFGIRMSVRGQVLYFSDKEFDLLCKYCVCICVMDNTELNSLEDFVGVFGEQPLRLLAEYFGCELEGVMDKVPWLN